MRKLILRNYQTGWLGARGDFANPNMASVRGRRDLNAPSALISRARYSMRP